MSKKLNTGNKNAVEAQKEESRDHNDTLTAATRNVKFEVGSKLYDALRANIKRRKATAKHLSEVKNIY